VLLWCYWYYQECDGRAEKAFIKWLPGMSPTPLQSLAKVYNCKRGLFWRIYGLNYCTALHFLEMERYQEHFEDTTYMTFKINNFLL
jgi:hypothetical protein